MISDFTTLAIRNFKKRKLRSFLTLLGILISISTIFVLISLSLGLEDVVNEQFQELGADKFFIQPKGQLGHPGTEGAAMLTEDDVQVIEKVQGVKEISYWTIGNAKIEYNKEIRFVNVLGFNLEKSELFYDTYTTDPEEGRVLKEGDTNDITIGAQYKYNSFFSKQVQLGDKIKINDKEFKVEGIMDSVGNPPDDRAITMPEPEFRELFNIPDRIDAIVVQIEENSDINYIAGNVEKKLRNSRDVTKKTQDFMILTPEEVLESFGSVLNIVTSFLLGVAAISLLVGGIGIANTIYTSVLERTREIGIMKAVGAKNSTILSIFLIESGFLGFIGGVLGVIFGIIAVKSVEYYAITLLATSLLRASIPLYLIVGCLVFSFFIGAVSGLWPAWKATKVKPIEALRYE